jgi:hypothetical protein
MPADFKQSTNLAGKILASSRVATGSSDTTIYTVPGSSAVKIATFSITNTSTSAVTVSVSVVPSGGSIDGTHKVLSSYSLAANDTISSEDVLSALKGAMLDAGAFISLNVSAGAVVCYLLTGAVSS